MTGRRAGASAVLLTVLVVGMMLVLVMFAARTGPQRIVNGTLIDPSFGKVTPASTAPTHGLDRIRRQRNIDEPAVLTWISWIIGIGILLLLAWLSYRGLRLLRAVA